MTSEERKKENELILKVMTQTSKKAQKENREMGLPNVFYIDGKTMFELPNGELTTKDPFKTKK